MRLRLLGTESALSPSSGNNFGGATIVRLVNTLTSSTVITLNESDDSTLVASFTMAPNSIEYLEKASDQKIRGDADVMGNKVGYTH